MKDLLVISTFGEDAALEWFSIQQKMLDKYTTNYDFAVCLHEVETTEPFTGIEVLGEYQGDLLQTLPAMFNKAMATFRERKYKNYLLLDSDCFPVKHDWLKHLSSITEGYGYAAPMRTENLDLFPHPCALFIKGEHVQNDWWDFGRIKENEIKCINGSKTKDMGTGFVREVKNKKVYFPLIRTNFVNYHPILGAIYGDTFYHHGGGSRVPFFRSGSYWEKVSGKHYELGQNAYKYLSKNPDKFVQMLRGSEAMESSVDLRNFTVLNW